MANVSNDRDVQLLSSPIRLVSLPQLNYIKLTSDYPYFTVTNGIPNISAITITAELFGQLVGTPVFSIVSGASSLDGYQMVDNKHTIKLNYNSLTSETAVIRASLQYLGVLYSTDLNIGGQLSPPADVIANEPIPIGSLIQISWISNADADIAGYEVRETDVGWGVDSNFIFKGNANSCTTTPGTVEIPKSWYIRAYDTSGKYSSVSTTVSYTVQRPDNIPLLYYQYADTSLTNASITLRWDSVVTSFGLKEYIVSYINSSSNLVEIAIRSNVIVLEADWVGDRLFTVKTVDNLNNVSTGHSEYISKKLPDPVTNLRADVIDSSVLLYWNLPIKTSLPISHVLIKSSKDASDTWDTAKLVGIKDGEFTTIQELSGGNYRYWLKTVDTDGNESLLPTTITVKVNQPSDYIFNAEFNSTFSSTKVNAYASNAKLVIPVNTTESWEEHYLDNGWTTPADQYLSAPTGAGLPIYVQPGLLSGTYEEIFDTGNGLPAIIGSSNVTVTFNSRAIVGLCSTKVTISVSSDGELYSQTVTGFSGFFTNFRFIKVNILVEQNTYGSLVELSEVDVRVDTKIKTDSATANVSSADINGSIVNFNSEFIDVVSVNITPSSSVVRIPVYELKDTIISATYSITGGIITVNCSEDHELFPGQNVRLSTTTGSIPVVVLPVLSRVSDTVFTVEYSEASAGSGDLYLYPQGMRVYLLNSAGGRESGKISWTVRGS
jgi:hypothetical protein